MNTLQLFKISAFALLFFFSKNLEAQEKKNLLVDISYHVEKNTYPYLLVSTKAKVDKQFLPIKNIVTKVFIGEVVDANLLGTVTTNKEGKAFVFLPVSVKNIWDTASAISFKAIAIGNKIFDNGEGETTINKAKINIDTTLLDGVRNIVATATAKQGNNWVPIKEVELKLIVKRTVGNLSVGDKETYTTDSLGQVTVEFKKLGIVGDAKGNLTIVAKTEDNELYGSISTEKLVPWGSNFVSTNSFDRRTLFATRDKAPIWLLILATCIIVAVWAVIFYLLKQIFLIKKLGENVEAIV